MAAGQRILDQALYPLDRFALPIAVQDHVPVGSFQNRLRNHGTCQLLDKLADRATAGHRLKAMINLVADGDRDLMRHTPQVSYGVAVTVQ